MKTSKQSKWLTFTIICLTTGVITELPYLRWALYEPLREFLNQDNTTFGMSASLFGLLAMILYIPGGWIADRFSHKVLFSASAIGCGLLGFWLSTAPDFMSVMIIHGLWAITNIGMFWPTMTKAISLLEDASGQGKVFGLFEGVRGVFVVVMWLGLMKVFELMGGVAAVIRALSILSIVCGVLSIFFMPDNKSAEATSSVGILKDMGKAARFPATWLCAGTILCVYSVYSASSYMQPYLPEGTTDEYIVPEQHNWGPRDYFKSDFYRHSTAHFISEIGYHGCPPLSSLARYIPADEMNDFAGGRAMRTHCTEYLDADPRGYNRNQLMLDQVRTLFGEVPSDPEALVLASQISQAEAKKYFVESTRLKKWRRTGVIWWNLLDGWPQISDAVVDYYFEKKLAFWYLQRVQQPVCLMVGELENWKHAVVLANDTRQAHTVAQLPGLPGEQKLYLLEWEAEGLRGRNHYISGFPPFDLQTYRGWLDKIRPEEHR